MKYKKIILLIIIFLLVMPPIAFALSVLFPNESISKKVNPIFKKIEQKIESPINKIAQKNLLNGEGEYGIYIKNLKTGEEYVYQQDKIFESASLYKLWVMAVVFQKIKDGDIDRDQVLSSPLKKLDDTLTTVSPTPLPEGVPSPTPEEEKFISMKTDEAIEKMITLSDNYAALLVASRSGNLAVANYIKTSGFVNSNFKQPPQTTAADIGRFYEMLYEGEIVDEEYSEEMIGILKRQALNDRIPKYLPDDIDVAHKTGELFGSKHDAGIVFGKKGDYIIVVMTETENQIDAAERTAKFSKEVFDYFEN